MADLASCVHITARQSAVFRYCACGASVSTSPNARCRKCGKQAQRTGGTK